MSAAPFRPPPETNPFPATLPPGEEAGLLDALPIAAAVIGRMPAGDLRLCAFNPGFENAVSRSTAGSLEQIRRSCLTGGSIADYLLGWFEGGAGDFLDFRDGRGPEARYYRMRMASLQGAVGDERRALVTVTDRTLEVRAERHLRAEMLRDGLTGLPNRLAFAEMIEAAARDKGDGRGGQAVLLVDLLRFGRINESLGSLYGDELLITFARRLVSAIRAGDHLARTGGNEFGIIVSLRNGAGDALAAADRIRVTLAAPFPLGEMDVRIEGAIGIALMRSGQEAEELFRNAQFALKRAKLSGRPEVYEPAEASAARRRFSIETELRRAVERDELRLAYQPLVDLGSGRVTGFEALARWTHSERGEISPNEFIPVAEESGLILALGRWAVHSAAQQLAAWDRESDRSLPFTVAVNMSAIQVARDDVRDLVEDALRSSGVAGSRLGLELTESAIVQDPGRATRAFDALKSLGASLAMDDFGTGCSSLAYLQRLPIDVLKIDRSFVSAMMVDPDSVAIVRAVLGLADALGMTATAEGIEDGRLGETLAAMGCATGQGFHFGEPLPADRVLDFFVRNERDARSAR